MEIFLLIFSQLLKLMLQQLKKILKKFSQVHNSLEPRKNNLIHRFRHSTNYRLSKNRSIINCFNKSKQYHLCFLLFCFLSLKCFHKLIFIQHSSVIHCSVLFQVRKCEMFSVYYIHSREFKSSIAQ